MLEDLLMMENSLKAAPIQEIRIAQLSGYFDVLLKHKESLNEEWKEHFTAFKRFFESWENFYIGDFKLRRKVDPKNPESALSEIVGNDNAVKILSIVLFTALHQPGHVCTRNFAFVGPPSAGKTMISSIFAEILDLPHIEIFPQAVNNVSDVIKAIGDALGVDLKGGPWLLPPMVILLDEAHSFNSAVIQSLLKATDRNDAVLVGNGASIDCRNVCWHFATTDLGKMFDAFITRFQKINLRLYTKDEISEIIQKNNPDWDKSICTLVAGYANRIPREALAFAEFVKETHTLDSTSWEDAAATSASAFGIDEYGMTIQRLNILRALGQRPMSITQLCATAGCKEEELKKYVLPWLLESTPDQAPYVITGNRHYITKEGLAELDKRGISNKGEEVLCSAE